MDRNYTKQNILSMNEGVKSKESRLRKTNYCVFFFLGVVFCFTLFSLHASRLSNARKVNDAYRLDPRCRLTITGEPMIEKNKKGKTNEPIAPYDSCLIPTFQPDPKLSVTEVETLYGNALAYCT